MSSSRVLHSICASRRHRSAAEPPSEAFPGSEVPTWMWQQVWAFLSERARQRRSPAPECRPDPTGRSQERRWPMVATRLLLWRAASATVCWGSIVRTPTQRGRPSSTLPPRTSVAATLRATPVRPPHPALRHSSRRSARANAEQWTGPPPASKGARCSAAASAGQGPASARLEGVDRGNLL